MGKQNRKNQKKDNKIHQVNSRLTESEYQKLSSMSKKAKVSNSALIRRFINHKKVEIRYDGEKVIEEVCKIQSDINRCHHMILERIDKNEQEISSLKALGGMKLVKPPFRIDIENVACDLAAIKKDTIDLKMKADKELVDHVNF